MVPINHTDKISSQTDISPGKVLLTASVAVSVTRTIFCHDDTHTGEMLVMFSEHLVPGASLHYVFFIMLYTQKKRL